jgi:hypothetical protein
VVVLFGLAAIAAAMALGIYGLVHRGLELVVGMTMLALVALGLTLLVYGVLP